MSEARTLASGGAWHGLFQTKFVRPKINRRETQYLEHGINIVLRILFHLKCLQLLGSFELGCRDELENWGSVSQVTSSVFFVLWRYPRRVAMSESRFFSGSSLRARIESSDKRHSIYSFRAWKKGYPGASREERQRVLCGGGNCARLGRGLGQGCRPCAPTKRYNW